MTFDEYQKEALRTASMGLGYDVETCIRALGLVGEAAEFRDACLNGTAEAETKEAGDVLWYAATLAYQFGLGGAQLGVGELADVPAAAAGWAEAYNLALMVGAAEMAEIVKKAIGHKKPVDKDKVTRILGNMVHNLAMASVPNLDDIAKANVAKLRARYPGGWDIKIAAVKPDSTEPA